MELITGHTGVAHIRSEDDAVLNQACYGKGHFVLSTASFPEEHTDHSITIYPGDALMDGRLIRIRNGESETFDLYPPGTGLVAGDIIYIEYKKQNGIESAELKIARGTASASEVVLPDIADSEITPTSTEATFPLYSVIYNGTTVQSVNPLFHIGKKTQCDVTVEFFGSASHKAEYSQTANIVEIANGVFAITVNGEALWKFRESPLKVTLTFGSVPFSFATYYSDFKLIATGDTGETVPSSAFCLNQYVEDGSTVETGASFTVEASRIGSQDTMGIRYKFFALAW